MEHRITFNRLLLLFFLFICLMIAIRIIYTGERSYLFLIWNLFLAWIPFSISTFFGKWSGCNNLKKGALLCLWLLFFPNALYIVTDLIHIDSESGVPKWYDSILIFTSSLLGLMMAFISLSRLEKMLGNLINKKIFPWIVPFLLFLGSYGVYLGRFLRWNSWDIIRHPLAMFQTMAEQLVYPFAHIKAWGITGLLTILFYLLYMAVKKMPGTGYRANYAEENKY